jgi:hypothetical protein
MPARSKRSQDNALIIRQSLKKGIARKMQVLCVKEIEQA